MKQYIRLALIAAFLLSALTACGGPCTSCDGRDRGGQIMNQNNVSQGVWGFLDQFDTNK